jgi:hypothetical protein
MFSKFIHVVWVALKVITMRVAKHQAVSKAFSIY